MCMHAARSFERVCNSLPATIEHMQRQQERALRRLAELIASQRKVLFITGAGLSAPSGEHLPGQWRREMRFS
jgi:hypothetical protein